MDNSVTRSLVSRVLTISVHDGVNASGTARIKNRSFSNINAEADDEALYSTAVALGGLMNHEVANIFFNEKNLLQAVEDDVNA